MALFRKGHGFRRGLSFWPMVRQLPDDGFEVGLCEFAFGIFPLRCAGEVKGAPVAGWRDGRAAAGNA
eukprot:11599824-Alexandrium_andersonii.AAC.2